MAMAPDLHTTSRNESHSLLNDRPSVESQLAKASGPTPLPKAQLSALCSVRLVDPIAFTQIFPYVNEFMNKLHLTDDPSKVGFYSGLVESAFALAQLCSIYQWAQLSNVVGRKPVIILGTAGLGVATVFFGLSKSLPEVLLSRCLAGLFSGNVAVIHSVLGELTDSTNQALAFPIYGLFWPLGSIIGPLLGGAFSNPATKYPDYFDYQMFRTYPYFLPCFVAAVVAAIGVLLAYYFLDETLPSKQSKHTGSYGATDSQDDTSIPLSPPSIKELLSIPIIRALCSSGCALSFIATAFDVVFVLFCYSPIQTGGLSFSARISKFLNSLTRPILLTQPYPQTSQIGYSLAIAGSISAGIQLFFLPTLLRTFDVGRMYSFCMGLWPYTFLALPVLNLLARKGVDDATGLVGARIPWLLWTGIASVLACSRIGCLAYSISMILVKENAPNLGLGTLNGLVQFAMCLARALSPIFVSSAFTLSIDNVLGGYLWVIIMVLVSLLGCYTARNVAQSNKESPR